MKSLIFIVSSLMIALFSFGQSNEGKIKLGIVQKLPMIHGKIFKYESHGIERADNIPGVAIESKTDSVFSVCYGKVSAVFDLGNGETVVVKDSLDRFYTYTALSKTFVQKADILTRGSFIGLAYEHKEAVYSLIFMIATKDGRNLNEDKVWQLIKDE